MRIAPVLDVVEPRAKEEEAESAYPGFFEKSAPFEAQGRTHVLEGVAVLAVAKLPGAQEGLIDMRRGGEPLLPFRPNPQCRAALRIARARCPARKPTRLSGSQRSRWPNFWAAWQSARRKEWTDTLQWPLPDNPLPRAALVYFVQSQGDLRRTYLYGQPMDEMPPRVISPLSVLDGALVSGNFVMACNKSSTYIHTRNPLITEMFRQHGKTLNFRGIILANEMSRLEDKQQTAAGIVELARKLGVAGVVINQEGGANTLTDVMMLCSLLEAEAIKTVLILNEFAGHDGTTPSLAETTREAEHIVSTGNNDYLLHLPPSERFVGSDTFPGVEGSITGPIALPLTRIHSSTNQLGFGRLSCGSDAAPLVPRAKMEKPWRVVHYLNQFFGQIGGEDKADAPLQVKAGAGRAGACRQRAVRSQRRGDRNRHLRRQHHGRKPGQDSRCGGRARCGLST